MKRLRPNTRAEKLSSRSLRNRRNKTLMSWQTISDISQIVSSMAVVLSVLYLGIQVHQSTRVARVAAQDAAATAFRDVTKVFMENTELSRVWSEGLINIDALAAEEQA